MVPFSCDTTEPKQVQGKTAPAIKLELELQFNGWGWLILTVIVLTCKTVAAMGQQQINLGLAKSLLVAVLFTGFGIQVTKTLDFCYLF